MAQDAEVEKEPSKAEDQFFDNLRKKLPTPLVIGAVCAISIGQFNDTIDMVQKGSEALFSTFSDTPSNNRLSNIYIRASSDVLDETFGAPVYTKYSDGKTAIKYYKDDNFLLSAVTSNGIIDAYLVFPEAGFVPATEEHAGGENYLNEHFSDSTTPVTAISNLARSGNYYIESSDGGRYQLLYTSVGGYSEYLSSLTGEQTIKLAKFNDQLMMEEDVEASLEQVRANISPNFYGYSTVDLAILESAILTRLEYELISK